MFCRLGRNETLLSQKISNRYKFITDNFRIYQFGENCDEVARGTILPKYQNR